MAGDWEAVQVQRVKERLAMSTDKLEKGRGKQGEGGLRSRRNTSRQVAKEQGLLSDITSLYK